LINKIVPCMKPHCKNGKCDSAEKHVRSGERDDEGGGHVTPGGPVVEQSQDGQQVEEGAKEGAEGSDDPVNENLGVLLVLLV
jgi:hypothetical protein